MADAYEEKKKYVKWVIGTLLIALILFYFLLLLALPLELWFAKGLSIDTLNAAIDFWKKCVVNVAALSRAYARWWGRLSDAQNATFATYIPLMPFVVLIMTILFGLFKNPYKNQINVFGEGRMATWADIKKMGLFDGKYVVLGRFKGRFMKMNETLSALVVAPPGTGKTAGVVVPTIFETPDCSLIVNDPKPELCDMTSGYRATQGPVFIINWGKEDDPEKGIYYPSWNPLSPQCLPPLGPARDMYIDSMLPILIEEPKGGADPHWSRTGRNAKSGFLHFISSKCERARANDYFVNKLQEGSFDAEDAEILKTYYMDMQDVSARVALDALNSGNLTLGNYAPVGTWDGIPQNWYGCEPCIAMILEWWNMLATQAAAEIKRRADEGDQMAMMSDPIKSILETATAECTRFGYSHRAELELRQLAATPDKERGSILSTAFNGIGIFKNAAVVMRTRFSDFTFRDLRGMVDPVSGQMKPVTVYLSVDQVDARALNVITGIFVELMSAYLIANKPNHIGADGQQAGPYPVMFVLDEFPQMPKLAAVKDGPAVGRGQKVSYLLIGQDLGQISGQYGKDDLETIITTTAAKVILAQNNEQTAERFVKMVGTKTIEIASRSKQEGLNAPSGSMFTENVSRSLQQSNVLTVADLTSLPKLKQYVLMQGWLSRPILADSPYWFMNNKMKKKGAIPPAPNVPNWIVAAREFQPEVNQNEQNQMPTEGPEGASAEALMNAVNPSDEFIAPMTDQMNQIGSEDMPESEFGSPVNEAPMAAEQTSEWLNPFPEDEKPDQPKP